MSKRRSSGSSRGQSSLGYLFGTTSNDEVDDHSKMMRSPAPVSSNSGGGQSSLGYLFGSKAAALSQETSNHNDELIKLSSSPTLLPPYGTHDDNDMVENTTPSHPLIKKDDHYHNGPSPKSSNTTCVVYHKVDGNKSSSSGDFLITGRPSTRVTSAPGGNSSIGYLFEDK